ncbi:hypothetical protein D3C83_70330 [compost metagenome]
MTVTSTSMGAMGKAPGMVTKQVPAFGSVIGRPPPVRILLVAGSSSKIHANVPSPFSRQLG